MNYRASRVDRLVLDTDRQVESNSTITLFGIVVANCTASGVAVEVQDGEGTAKMTLAIPPFDTRIVDIEWVADKGIQFSGTTLTGVIATVFHSGPSS